MTGAPIYLVSACASGEEFVAAFRRYADKNGLFVPISEPLPSGCRSRFAVTLKDGGVMIEGEAEIISSARTASVLHGRVGMTLRFIHPDDASKTMLGELEKARLSMRPPPPSVSPRPAEIPAGPRPVPPPVQGRIDAVNALAECVAIGDTQALAPSAATAPVPAPPKAGPKFVVPTVPPASGLGGAPRPATSPKLATPAQAATPPRTTPSPQPIAKADGRADRNDRNDALPPSSTPRAPTPIDQLRKGLERRTDPAQAIPAVSGFSSTMTAVAPLLDPGPASDTMVAVAPPEPPAMRPGSRPPTTPTPTAVTVPPTVVTALPTAVTVPPTAVAAPPPIATPPATPTTATPPAVPRRAVEMAAAIPRPITKPHAATSPDAPAPDAPASSSAHPAEAARNGRASNTMNAVPVAGTMLPSAPTDIGGVLVDPLPAELAAPTPAHDEPSSRTQLHAGAPTPEAQAGPPARTEVAPKPRGPVIDLLQTQRSRPPEMPKSSRVPESVPESVPELAIDDEGSAGSGLLALRGATHVGMPPVPRSPAPASPPPPVLRPAPPIVAPERPPVPDVEIAEPTDISSGPPEAVVEPSPPVVAAPRPSERPSPNPNSRQRKTVIGVPIAPPGVTVLPATMASPGPAPRDAADASILVADELTGADRIVVGDNTVDASAPTMPPDAQFEEMLDEVTPIVDLDTSPAKAPPASSPGTAPKPAKPPSLPKPAKPAPPADPAAALPNGDWTIALDPQAPDGWTEPVEPVAAEPVAEAPPPVPPPAVANAKPRTSAPKLSVPRADELPVAEPKVQIDPTLIEPLQAMPPDPALRPMPPDMPWQAAAPDDPFRHAASSSLDLPSYGVPPGVVATAAPPMNVANMMPPVPQANLFQVPHGQSMIPGEAPAYPIDPNYQMVPVPGLPVPGAFTAGDSGLGDPRYSSATAMPVHTARRRLIIVIVSALVAVVIGIVVLATRGGKHDTNTTPGSESDKPRAPAVTPKPSKTSAATTTNTTDPAAPDPKTPPAPPAAGSGNPAAATGSNAVAGAAPPAATTCFAEITSVPTGAEIVIDQTNVIGTTPKKVTLPCGAPVELMIRKGRLVPATRTVTPAPDGVKLKVTLAKQTFQLKVSSTPAGATIMLNGKPLGITTPTTVKVPAFEASTLTIAKDGYATETETVTPKSNGLAVHTTLKKLDRKKPR